jgi:hypothetical protein
MAASAQGYYPDGSHMPGPSASMYQGYTNGGAAAANYHHSGGQYQANYMTTLYPVTPSATQEYELRKKATFDALNEFFGDIKSRSIDPTMYHAVGQRLMQLQNVPGYVNSGDYGSSTQTAVASASHFQQGNNHYTLPTIRTKHDLLNVDSVLDQLQSTVYEHETQAAMQGIQVRGAHAIPTHTNHPPHIHVAHRSSISPPRGGSSISSGGSLSFSTTLPPITTAVALDTPALTPASTVMSYSSPQSSAADRVSLSPTNRPELLYPAVTASSLHEAHSAHYPVTTASAGMSANATALPSTLNAHGYDHHPHNFDSGRLQRMRDGPSPELNSAASVMSDDTDDSLPRIIGRLGVRSPSVSHVDPALWEKRSASSRGSLTPTVKEEGEIDSSASDPQWIVKVRVLEALRAYVRHRLDNEMWDDGSSDEGSAKRKMVVDEVPSLYPVIGA